MIGRVCAITGASSGLGFETALELARMGATVAMLCRSSERGEAARERVVQRSANADVHVVRCDHADLDSVRAAAANLQRRFDALHVLVNNAGLMLSQREITIDGVEHTFQVNHLSAFLLTTLLRERLSAALRAGSSPSHRSPTPARGWTSATCSSPTATTAGMRTRAPSSPTSCSPTSWRAGCRARA